MGHKFDGEWSCFQVLFEDNHYHTLDFIGTMYLKFKPDGVLEEGSLEYDGDRVGLEGKADSGFGARTIQLTSDDYEFFEGILTYESDERESLAVTGKLHYPENSRLKLRFDKKKKIKAQDDPPWVITKP